MLHFFQLYLRVFPLKSTLDYLNPVHLTVLSFLDIFLGLQHLLLSIEYGYLPLLLGSWELPCHDGLGYLVKVLLAQQNVMVSLSFFPQVNKLEETLVFKLFFTTKEPVIERLVLWLHEFCETMDIEVHLSILVSLDKVLVRIEQDCNRIEELIPDLLDG